MRVTSQHDKIVLFNYTVALGDLDTDGISIAANKIGTSSGFEFVDEAGNMPNLTHTALTTQASHISGWSRTHRKQHRHYQHRQDL